MCNYTLIRLRLLQQNYIWLKGIYRFFTEIDFSKLSSAYKYLILLFTDLTNFKQLSATGMLLLDYMINYTRFFTSSIPIWYGRYILCSVSRMYLYCVWLICKQTLNVDHSKYFQSSLNNNDGPEQKTVLF